MKNKPTSGAKLQRYDAVFKAEAVRLWRSSGRAAEVIAQELGISTAQLYQWGREGAESRVAGTQRPPESKEELQAKVAALEKEVARLTEQRDILKKAAGILSEPSTSGMPKSRS